MTVSQRILAIFYISAGVNHFVQPKTYEAIMPDYLPRHRELVLWSGVAEIIGGAAVIHPKSRTFARWWILGVLTAVFPAHVHMVQNPDRYKKIPVPALWARMPMQVVLGYWAWKATEP